MGRGRSLVGQITQSMCWTILRPIFIRGSKGKIFQETIILFLDVAQLTVVLIHKNC
jgi:hypothetical protein